MGAIEAVVSRAELRAALVLVNDNVPLADAADPDDWRTDGAAAVLGSMPE
ncbi:hypothetical protein [Actinomadura soli]|nr:hypothetical protein [Actinomadura soli]